MNNSPWFFIAIGVMVAVITISKAYCQRIKNSKTEQSVLDREMNERLKALESRSENFKSRLENVESILIDYDREQKFKDLK